MISSALRWSVAAVTLLFAGLCGALAVQGAIVLDARLGLTLYMVAQSMVYATAAVALLTRRWRLLTALLGALGLLQLVYAAEVNPTGSLPDTLWGILVGGMGPTLLLAGAAIAAWAMSPSRRSAESGS